MKRFLPVLALAVLAAAAAPALADDPKPASAEQAAMLRQLVDAQDKLIELAGAMPAEKMTWAPGEGVRSAGEVFLHLAIPNYFIPAMFGQAPPQGVNPMTLEKSTTDRDAIVKHLQDSFARARLAIATAPPAGLDSTVELFGMKLTKRDALMILVTHAHEHLGQSIAYARMNGITPPWTAREQAAAAERKAAAEAKKAEGDKSKK